MNQKDKRKQSAKAPWTYGRSGLPTAMRLVAWLLASALTACTALLIPLSDLLTAQPVKMVDYQTVELANWRPPPPKPPPPPPPKPQPPADEPPPQAPEKKPTFERPDTKPQPKLKLPVKLDFALQDFSSDLALDFEVDPTVENLPEQAAPPPPPPPAPPPPKAEPEPLDKQPQIVSQVKPIYPYRARTRRIEGYVDLQFTVLANGRAAEVVVLDAQPDGIFERAAVRAVERWNFSPGVRDGQPVEVRMQIRIRFTLDE